MTKETVVHVETIDQWKSVLDVWFAQGYEWLFSGQDYSEKNFEYSGSRQLALNIGGDDEITCFLNNDYTGDNLIEYEDFMSQQEKTMTKETYYVTQEQLDFLNTMYEELYSLDELLNRHTEARNLFYDFSITEGNAVLRYLGGDTSVEFKTKEQLYRLWRIDDDGTRLYMKFSLGTPIYTEDEKFAFTAPHEEIEKWKTPAWSVEEVD